MSRAEPALRPPRPGDAERLPARAAPTRVYRAVDRRHPQPWHFSNRDETSDPGRFDLAGDGGTCSLAATAVGAILEAFGDPEAELPVPVTPKALAQMRVWHGELRRPVDLADTTTPSIPTMTGEIGTITPYTVPHAWADAVHAAGRDGIIYRGRFAQDDCVALFAPKGIPVEGDGSDPRDLGDLEATEALAWRDQLPSGVLARAPTLGDLPSGRAPR